MAARFSGPAWCSEFPCSTLTTNLASPFRENAERFIEALRNAGASVTISTTFRPPERAYLMHFAWLIAKRKIGPDEVPSYPGVDVDWTCGGDETAAIVAAKAMVDAYGIAYQPTLRSRHTEGRAIDMTILWRGTSDVVDARGVTHSCSKQEDLWAVGASYGVRKLPSDPPHWSDDGH